MSHLLTPYEKGKLKLKNRLVMPPMATSKAQEDGRISKDIIDYYNEKSKGGYISLIIIEHSYVSKNGQASPNQLSIASDDFIDDLKVLSETIHNNGSKAVMQINHAGSQGKKEIVTNPVGPSPVLNPRNSTNVMPKELSKEEIRDIVNYFKEAALRVKKAGFDGVEIHSAHAYLLNQFISPLTNKRTDEYGGDINNRIRIHLEVIEAVKEVVGEEFPILLRLGATDDNDDGLSLEDAITASQSFEKAGVDILDISGGMCGYTSKNYNEQGYFSLYSGAIKKAVNIPVILTGGITEPAYAEQLLRDSKADFIGVGRSILKDSEWAKRAVESC